MFYVAAVIGLIFLSLHILCLYCTKPSVDALRRTFLKSAFRSELSKPGCLYKDSCFVYLSKDWFLLNVGYVYDSLIERDKESTRIADIYPRVIFFGILGKWRYWKCIKE